MEYDEGEDELELTNKYSSRNVRSGGTVGVSRVSRLQRRNSPPKHLNKKPPGPNQYSTTAYISNGEDNAVNISITSNGNNTHDVSKKNNTQTVSNQSKNMPICKRNTAAVNGANNSTNIRGNI